MRFAPPVVLVCAATLPAGAFAADYMSADQAARSMFPGADTFERVKLAIDAAAQQTLDAGGVRPHPAPWHLLAARAGKKTLGWVVVDEVIGKFELITFAVGVNLDGSVQQVEVLSYRESHGQEIRLPAWRGQFVGKTAAAPLRLGDDIANISGATMSCHHVTQGVRRIVMLIDLARRQNLL